MKYRKTALVDAEQFLPVEGKIPAGVRSSGLSNPRKSPEEWVLDTLEGQHTLRNGDYICTGPGGDRWNVEQSIFEATYEPAASSTPVASGGQHSSGEVEAAWLEAEAQLSEISAAIGSVRFMDPPDGGSVTLAEQVRRMRIALEEVENVTAPVAETAGEAAAWIDPADLAQVDEGLATETVLFPREHASATAPLYAAPVPAQDDDKLRRAVEAYETMRSAWSFRQASALHSDRTQYHFACGAFDKALDASDEALAALRSTAAQEGGSR